MTKQGKDAPPRADETAASAPGSPIALEVIKPSLSLVERRRRRRMLMQSMLITFFLTFGWIAAMVVIQLLRTTAYNFNAETQLVLQRIRDNRAELVYEEASPVLQETMVLDRFQELASDIRTTFGEYREILAIKRVEKISGPGGVTARAKATLLFERARTTASFSYHYYRGAWRLMHLSIDIPDELAADVVSRDETKSARKEAPAEVYARTEEVLLAMRDGRAEQVYEDASEIFKASIDRDTFLRNHEDNTRQLGDYIRILDIMRTKRNQSRSMATLTMLVEYEKAKSTVVIDFRKSGDDWRLSYYKVEIPLARVPTTAPERPPP